MSPTMGKRWLVAGWFVWGVVMVGTVVLLVAYVAEQM